MSDQASERIFQDDILRQLQAQGWLLGASERYNRELALYPEDALGFVQETQPAQWQRFCTNHPKDSEQKFLELIAGRKR
jgi:type I restriction enzyme R subunit